MFKIKRLSTSTQLLLLCWVVYTCSYIGKLGYNANINQIALAYHVSYSDAGMVSTFFFVAYGAGQVINGLLCKHYNPKYIIFVCLFLSGIINLAVPCITEFSFLKYLWMMNGAVMSFLWTLIIRLLSETLSKEEFPKAVLAMGTTVATGTFLIYGMSALFSATLSWHFTFYVAAAVLLIVAVIWILNYYRLVTVLKRERQFLEIKSGGADTDIARESGLKNLWGVLVVFAFFATANNFVKDGITTWTPSILSTLYHTPEWMSILLTLLLPLMAIGGTALALKLNARLQSNLGTCTLMFFATIGLIFLVILGLQTKWIFITVGCLSLVSCLMAGINNVITNVVPLYMKNHINSGTLAGVLNGFCYVGSAVSSYILGSVADMWGWLAVFIILILISGVAVGIGLLKLIFDHQKQHKLSVTDSENG